jgi:hypothetical protein
MQLFLFVSFFWATIRACRITRAAINAKGRLHVQSKANQKRQINRGWMTPSQQQEPFSHASQT